MSPDIGAIVLAAGFSSRFGDVKLCARLASGRTVLQQTLDNIQVAIKEVLVVTRPDLAPLLALDTIEPAICPDADQGMGATLAFGMQTALHRYQWRGCLVCLGDMPFIRPATYRLLGDQLDSRSIVIPRYNQRSGNPVGFGQDFFPALTRLGGDRGGRDLIRQHPQAVLQVDLDDPAILQDIDTPEDLVRYQAADKADPHG